MNSNLKMLQNWWTLAKPKIPLMFFQFFTVLLRYVLLLLSPIFAAKATTCLYASDWGGAVLNLGIEIGVIILSAISFSINYHCMNYLICPIYSRMQNAILDKVLDASNRNFKKISKEKLINIIGADTYYVAYFADTLSGRLARFVRVIITIVVVFCINWKIGLLGVAIVIGNYFILNFIHEKKAVCVKKLKESNDHIFSDFSQFVDSKELIKTLDMKDKIRQSFEASSVSYCKEKHKNDVFQSYIDNTYYSFYKIVVFLVSIFMILLVSKMQLDLTTYLVLVPYVLSIIEIANDALNILPQLKEANIATNRIRSVLKFTNTKKLPVGENAEDFIEGYVNFENVSYRGNKSGSPRLDTINLYLRQKQTSMIYGERHCGKRALFHMLSRQIKPTKGNVEISDMNIFGFNDRAYSKNFNYITTKPFVYKGSIMKNFKMIEKSEKKIKEVCKKIGLEEIILSYSNGYNSDATAFTQTEQYLITLARAILTNCEILALYELPSNLSAREYDIVKKALYSIHGYITLIIFSHNDNLFEVCDKIIQMQDGKIKNICFNSVKSLDLIV